MTAVPPRPETNGREIPDRHFGRRSPSSGRPLPRRSATRLMSTASIENCGRRRGRRRRGPWPPNKAPRPPHTAQTGSGSIADQTLRSGRGRTAAESRTPARRGKTSSPPRPPARSIHRARRGRQPPGPHGGQRPSMPSASMRIRQARSMAAVPTVAVSSPIQWVSRGAGGPAERTCA